jgi:hypothetical protein
MALKMPKTAANKRTPRFRDELEAAAIVRFMGTPPLSLAISAD